MFLKGICIDCVINAIAHPNFASCVNFNCLFVISIALDVLLMRQHDFLIAIVLPLLPQNFILRKRPTHDEPIQNLR